MALEYKSNIGVETLIPILDEHVVWYGQMMRVYFERSKNVPKTPNVFEEWMSEAEKDDSVSSNIAQRLRRLHGDMVKAGTMFAARAMMWDENPSKEFLEFTKHYEEFIQFMRRIEREQTLENSGIDEKTGLRSLKVMKDDIAREMQRRSRAGNPFALALVKINNFDDDWMKEEEPFMLTIRKISDQLRFTLRSFDDAYYLGGAYFLLSLKHADKVGSQVAASRLSGGVNNAHILVPQLPDEPVSISVLVAEPVEGDDIDIMIANMKKDLEGVDVKGTILQYNDISPLQRFVSTMTKQ